MPFVSIDPTDPRTNPAQFCKKKILRIHSFENCILLPNLFCPTARKIVLVTLARTDLLYMLNWGTQWKMVSYLKKINKN